MNFIYTILLFLLISAGFRFAGASVSSAEAKDVMEFFHVVAIILAVGALVVGFFNNLYLRGEQRRMFNRIRTAQKSVDRAKEMVATYKSEMEGFLTKMYPDYEREVFKNIPPADAETIHVYMQKYPDLKFNGVLTTFTQQLTQLLNAERDARRDLEEVCHDIRVRNECEWFMLKPAMPQRVFDKVFPKDEEK